jgi:5-bromo-4-chloroindolyl phosphate hydrolysis protein
MGNNKNWSQLGDEIEEMVRSAMESQDFKKLNETIGNTVDEALENVQRAVDRAQGKVRQKEEASYKNTTRFQPGYEKKREKEVSSYRERYKNTSGIKSTGVVLTACGFTFLGTLLLVLGIVFPLTVIRSSIVAFTTAGIMAPFILGSTLMAYQGLKLLGRSKRFGRYVEAIRDREYCQIKELAGAVGKSESFVVKDLKKMIKTNLFRKGRLDKQETCLMVTDGAYEQYRIAEEQLEVRMREEQQKKAEAAKMGTRSDLPQKAKEVIAAGKAYLEEIRKSNDRIPGLEVSEKISHLELVISKIFGRVEQHPELVDDLGKFMDYYLPTTVKLLKAYEDLDSQPVQGNNIKASKRDIENTLDTIGKAFENLLDSFFEQASWDISADISVLQNMFVQEGLTKSEFEKVREGAGKGEGYGD